MFGNTATIVGGLLTSAAFFGQRVVLYAQQADPGVTGNVATGLGVSGLILAITGLVREILKHRETMYAHELLDRVALLEVGVNQGRIERDQLRAQLDHSAAQFGRAKHLISIILPALQVDRALVIRANAKYPDEFPLPDGFMDREFDRDFAGLLGTDSLLTTMTPSKAILDMIEGSRPMPESHKDSSTPSADPGRRG